MILLGDDKAKHFSTPILSDLGYNNFANSLIKDVIVNSEETSETMWIYIEPNFDISTDTFLDQENLLIWSL